MSTGAIIGGILGGVGGGLINPALAKSGYALGSSIGGAAEGMSKWRQANKMQISPTDPRQVQLLNEIMQKRRALEAGAMYQPQQDAIAQQGAYGMNRAARATGGDIGSTINALAMINRGTGRNLNELYGNMMNQSMNMMGQQQQLATTMANRDYAVQAYDKQQAMGDSARILQNSMANLSAYAMRNAKGGTGNVLGSFFNKVLGGGTNGGASEGLNVGNIGGAAATSLLSRLLPQTTIQPHPNQRFPMGMPTISNGVPQTLLPNPQPYAGEVWGEMPIQNNYSPYVVN